MNQTILLPRTKRRVVLLVATVLIGGCCLQMSRMRNISQLAGSTEKKGKDLSKLTRVQLDKSNSTIDSQIQQNFTAKITNNESTADGTTEFEKAALKVEEDSFSFCLLTRDDNDIINEWIAYHYHVLRLRHIIVALDPNSETSPKELLQVWKQNFGLNYTIWGDEDYMPDFFLQGEYQKVPERLGSRDVENVNALKNKNSTVQQVQALHDELNNHHFRQATFLKHCARAFQDTPGRKWVAHIDTDEYMVVNPLSWKDETKKGPIVSSLSNQVTTETISQPNYLMDLLIRWSKTELAHDILPCLTMPRLFFGSVENNDTKDSLEVSSEGKGGVVFLRNRMETIRWKYHAKYEDKSRNRLPKSIMDVSRFPQFNTSTPVHSIHRPNPDLCPKPPNNAAYQIQSHPLLVHHYLGSWERYSARTDAHRTKKIYDEKAHVHDIHQGNWMDVWLTGFVREHGVNKVVRVLGQYMDLNRTIHTTTPT